MARTTYRVFAKARVSMYQDEDFLGLEADERQLYTALWVHEGINNAGVATWRPEEMAHLIGRSATETDVRRCAAVLQDRKYIQVDPVTREVLVRSYIRNDDVVRQPNMCKPMVNAWRATRSPLLRQMIVNELHRLFDEGQRAKKMPAGFTMSEELMKLVDDNPPSSPVEQLHAWARHNPHRAPVVTPADVAPTAAPVGPVWTPANDFQMGAGSTPGPLPAPGAAPAQDRPIVPPAPVPPAPVPPASAPAALLAGNESVDQRGKGGGKGSPMGSPIPSDNPSGEGFTKAFPPTTTVKEPKEGDIGADARKAAQPDAGTVPAPPAPTTTAPGGGESLALPGLLLPAPVDSKKGRRAERAEYGREFDTWFVPTVWHGHIKNTSAARTRYIDARESGVTRETMLDRSRAAWNDATSDDFVQRCDNWLRDQGWVRGSYRKLRDRDPASPYGQGVMAAPPAQLPDRRRARSPQYRNATDPAAYDVKLGTKGRRANNGATGQGAPPSAPAVPPDPGRVGDRRHA